MFLRAGLSTLPVLAVTAYLYAESRGFERQLLEAETTREADYVSLQLQAFVADHVNALRSIGSFELADPGGGNRAEFTRFVGRVVADVPDFESIVWIDADGGAHPQTRATGRAGGSPDPSGTAFAMLRQKAVASRQPAAGGSFALAANEQAVAIAVPVFKTGGAYDGIVAGTIRLSQGMRHLFGPDVLDFWNLELKDRAGRVAYQGVSSAPASAAYVAPSKFIPVADHAWTLRLWPTPLLSVTLRTGAPPRIVTIGLVASLVVAVASYLLGQRQARLQESLGESERLAADVEATRRHLSDLVNGIEAVIWESDADIHRFTFVNDYARKLLGIDTTRWVAEPAFWFENVHPEDRARACEHARAARKPGQTYAAEYRMIAADERVLWVREIITVIGRDGRMVGRRGVVVDISARVRAEEAVRQSQKLESLGVLAGGIAHDFNNLLTTILGNAEMLGSFLQGDRSPGLNFLDKIQRTTRRLAELTRQMLAYSGHGRLSVEPVDINTIITEMTELLNVSTSKNVKVSYALDPRLPLIQADVVQMRQIVLNLLTNAAEAIGEHKPGTVSIRTSVNTMTTETGGLYPGQEIAPGTYVRLEVQDNGCGMTEETLSKIFDPFFTTKFTGRGLGLAALQGIVRGHHGGIRIASQPGEGTTFTLLFPASTEPAHAIVHQDHPQGVEHPGVDRATVLLVDDEESLRTLMATALEEAGTRVFEAGDGEEGLEQFHRHAEEIDVVVLDLTMPRLGGEAVFQRIRAARPGTCVILSSGYTEEDINRQFAGQGLSGFIEKPFTPSELIEKIRSVLAEDGHGGVTCAEAVGAENGARKVPADGA